MDKRGKKTCKAFALFLNGIFDLRIFNNFKYQPMNQELTQQQKILAHLQTNSITGLEAWTKYGVYRLSSLINRIRKQGHEVLTEMIEMDGHTFAKYSLLKLKQ